LGTRVFVLVAPFSSRSFPGSRRAVDSFLAGPSRSWPLPLSSNHFSCCRPTGIERLVSQATLLLALPPAFFFSSPFFFNRLPSSRLRTFFQVHNKTPFPTERVVPTPPNADLFIPIVFPTCATFSFSLFPDSVPRHPAPLQKMTYSSPLPSSLKPSFPCFSSSFLPPPLIARLIPYPRRPECRKIIFSSYPALVIHFSLSFPPLVQPDFPHGVPSPCPC